GVVTTVAGGNSGFRDGLASEAQFNAPCRLAREGDGILIEDVGNQRLRVLTGASVATRGPLNTNADARDLFSPPLMSWFAVAAPGSQPGHTVTIPLNHLFAAAGAGGREFALDSSHNAVFHLNGNSAEVWAGACEPARRVE